MPLSSRRFNQGFTQAERFFLIFTFLRLQIIAITIVAAAALSMSLP